MLKKFPPGNDVLHSASVQPSSLHPVGQGERRSRSVLLDPGSYNGEYCQFAPPQQRLSSKVCKNNQIQLTWSQQMQIPQSYNIVSLQLLSSYTAVRLPRDKITACCFFSATTAAACRSLTYCWTSVENLKLDPDWSWWKDEDDEEWQR